MGWLGAVVVWSGLALALASSTDPPAAELLRNSRRFMWSIQPQMTWSAKLFPRASHVVYCPRVKESYIAAKERWARKMAGQHKSAPRSTDRLPPGQRQVHNF